MMNEGTNNILNNSCQITFSIFNMVFNLLAANQKLYQNYCKEKLSTKDHDGHCQLQVIMSW